MIMVYYIILWIPFGDHPSKLERHIGNKLSKLIPIKVLVKRIHTNKLEYFVIDSKWFKQTHTNKAPTNKGKSPYELLGTLVKS